jgi:uncharacterized membrane protein YedE/YeeE
VDGLHLVLAGFVCGTLAGGAAQYGRLCTIGAIEDALVAGDLRRARAWALTAGIALLLTQGLVLSGTLDLSATHHAQPRLDLSGLIAGGLLFGLGAALVGTCAFGMLVRAGTGDLRAVVSALVLGLAAFAATGGILSPVRTRITYLAVIDLSPLGGKTLTGIAAACLGSPAAWVCALGVGGALLAFGLASGRLYRRPRLLAAAGTIGLAIAAGWIATGVLGDPFSAQPPESLSFVAPLARLILQVMGESLASTGFAVATVFGVAAGSFAMAALRDELRWEAFDDAREMRRHLLGAVLMGIGGILARGCTIGQGLTGTSTLSLAAPVAVLAMVAGARLGLSHLIEGRTLFARRR